LPQGSAPHPPPPPKSDTNIYLTCHTRWAGSSNSLTPDRQRRRRQPRYGADLFADDGQPRLRRAVANLGSPRVGLLSAPRALFFGAFQALNGRSEGARAPSAHGFLGALMGALNNNRRNILTTWSTECPMTLSAASMGAQPWMQVPRR